MSLRSPATRSSSSVRSERLTGVTNDTCLPTGQRWNSPPAQPERLQGDSGNPDRREQMAPPAANDHVAGRAVAASLQHDYLRQHARGEHDESPDPRPRARATTPATGADLHATTIHGSTVRGSRGWRARGTGTRPPVASRDSCRWSGGCPGTNAAGCAGTSRRGSQSRRSSSRRTSVTPGLPACRWRTGSTRRRRARSCTRSSARRGRSPPGRARRWRRLPAARCS